MSYYSSSPPPPATPVALQKRVDALTQYQAKQEQYARKLAEDKRKQNLYYPYSDSSMGILPDTKKDEYVESLFQEYINKDDLKPVIFKSKDRLEEFVTSIRFIFQKRKTPFLLISNLIRDSNNPDMKFLLIDETIETLISAIDHEIITGKQQQLQSIDLKEAAKSIKLTIYNESSLAYLYVLYKILKFISKMATTDESVELIKEKIDINMGLYWFQNLKFPTDTKNGNDSQSRMIKLLIVGTTSGFDQLLKTLSGSNQLSPKVAVSLRKFNHALHRLPNHVNNTDAILMDNQLEVIEMYQRHIHGVLNLHQESVDIYSGQKVIVSDIGGTKPFVITNVCNENTLLISYKVQGEPNRQWVYVAGEKSDRLEMYLIERPSRFTIMPLVKELSAQSDVDKSGFFTKKTMQNIIQSSKVVVSDLYYLTSPTTTTYFEFGLDRV